MLHPMYGQRVKLNDLHVSGGRKRLRDGVRVVIGALVVLVIIGFALERHRVSQSWSNDDPSWGPTHAYLSDTGPWPIVVMVFIGLAQWWGHRSRMLLGLVNAIVSLGVALLAAMGYALLHFLSTVEHGPIGEVLLPIALLGLMAACVTQIVVEPSVALAERRAIEARLPVLPSAVVVRQDR